ncbi:histidine kinase [Actinocorallia sp. B10E7]|uniref:sensor histidine kinase n=1 Tax=Actinocorallia sp. B10E7 TaxID=3153558 RepID=UPI00325E4F7F
MIPSVPRLPLSRRVITAVATVLAWGGGLLYPPVLFFSVAQGRQGFGVVEILPAALLTLLVASLVRRRPLPALLLLTVGWSAAMAEMPKPEVGILYAAITDTAVGYIAKTSSRRTSLAALAMVLLAQVTCCTLVITPVALPSTLGLLVLASVVAWLIGGSIRQSRLHAAQLAEQTAAQAVIAERLRIARELHDMVAHSIGIIAIQAGVGSRVIDTQPAEARNALSAIEATSRETLSGLRRMLGALRRTDPSNPAAPRGPAPGLADLDQLVRTTGDAGVRVDMRWRGERRPLPAEVDLSAFRIVQEAVTNVVRHAGTGHCRVSIGYQEEELVVEVVDDGAGSDPVDAGTGYGLVGMRERVGLLNGSLTAGPRSEGGFRVEARLPLPEAAR